MAKSEKRNRSRGSAGNNRKMGEDFLEKNRRKEGVRETGSGLQYLVLEEGEGDYPKENANITILTTSITIDLYILKIHIRILGLEPNPRRPQLPMLPIHQITCY